MILMPDGQDFQGLSSIKRVHSFFSLSLSLFFPLLIILTEIDIVDWHVTYENKTRRSTLYLWAWPGRPEALTRFAGWPPWTGRGPPPPLRDSDRRGGSCTRWRSGCWCWREPESRYLSPRRAGDTGSGPCGWKCSCVRRCRLCYLKVEKMRGALFSGLQENTSSADIWGGE